MARLLAVAGLAFAAATQTAAASQAFPEAQGFGANARGGRGGVVFEVTNLNDAGPGSLRACVEASQPRICVFRRGGTIQLLSPIWLTSPYITIAGQTAPGGGIALRLAVQPIRPASPLIIKNSHDVLIRHLRFRPGPSANRASTDALTVEDSHHVMVDHVSMSWAPDENLNAHEAVYNLTVQWSIMAEGLLDHSKGSLTCSAGWGCRNITLHHNLYVSNKDRNPDLNASPKGQLDIINNVVHNPKSEYAEVWGTTGGTRTNIVGNIFRKGPDTNSYARGIRYHSLGATGAGQIYASGNASEVPLFAPGTSTYTVAQPIGDLSLEPEAAATAYERVLARAGAWPRDAVDVRLVAAVRGRGGQLISDPAQVGGWPSMSAGVPSPDADHDGLPDAWEALHGLDQNDPNDRNEDYDRDGYTELEEYLNELAVSLVAK